MLDFDISVKPETVKKTKKTMKKVKQPVTDKIADTSIPRAVNQPTIPLVESMIFKFESQIEKKESEIEELSKKIKALLTKTDLPSLIDIHYTLLKTTIMCKTVDKEKSDERLAELKEFDTHYNIDKFCLDNYSDFYTK